MYKLSKKDRITKRCEKHFGADGIAYLFVRVGKGYACFVETPTGMVSVELKEASRACGFDVVAGKTSYQVLDKAWPTKGKTKKTDQILNLMRQPNGVTREEVLKILGWQAISMQDFADRAGVDLMIDKEMRPYRYKICNAMN